MKLKSDAYVKLFEKVCMQYSKGKLSFEKLLKRLSVLNRFYACMILLLLSGTAHGATLGECSYYNTASCQREGTSGVYTASGERFYDNAMTCAMRSRNFGKYYKVTNLENKKSVIVKHNDYGPNKKLAKRGRIIDLSEGAFRKIANAKVGLIQVKIEEVK